MERHKFQLIYDCLTLSTANYFTPGTYGFKLNMDGHQTNSILVSGIGAQKEKFGSLILVSEIGNYTIMSKTPETFMQEVNDTAIPMVKSFHWLGLL